MRVNDNIYYYFTAATAKWKCYSSDHYFAFMEFDIVWLHHRFGVNALF